MKSKCQICGEWSDYLSGGIVGNYTCDKCKSRNMLKKYLVGMTCSKETENIQEIVKYAPHFDGLIFSFNLNSNEVFKDKELIECAQVLEANRKAGKIVYREYNLCHGFALNEILFCGVAKHNSLMCQIDSSERYSPKLLENLDNIHKLMLENDIRIVYHNTKPLFYLYDENIQYTNWMHWGIMNVSGRGAIELKNIELFKDDAHECAYSLRNIQRKESHDPFGHECRYFFAAHTNHLELYYRDPEKLAFHKRNRLIFLNFLDKLGVKHTPEDLVAYLKSNPLSAEMRFFISQERFFKNLYRYHILGESKEAIYANEDSWTFDQIKQ